MSFESKFLEVLLDASKAMHKAAKNEVDRRFSTQWVEFFEKEISVKKKFARGSKSKTTVEVPAKLVFRTSSLAGEREIRALMMRPAFRLPDVETEFRVELQ